MYKGKESAPVWLNEVYKLSYSGIITPMTTPFNDDESLNLDGFRSEIKRLITSGVHGILILGTNGENYALSLEEKKTLISVAAETVDHRLPLFVGTGEIRTADTIMLSRKASSAGCDGVFVLAPYYAHLTQSQLLWHYTQVAKSIDLPLFIYNIPARTGINMEMATFAELAKMDVVCGMKDTSGNFSTMLGYIQAAKESGRDLSVFSGFDPFIYWCLAAGGSGAVAGTSNVYPHAVVGIYENFRKGNDTEARRLQEAILINRRAFGFANPNVVVKKLLAGLGYPVGKCRDPFNGVSEEGMAVIAQILRDAKSQGLN